MRSLTVQHRLHRFLMHWSHRIRGHENSIGVASRKSPFFRKGDVLHSLADLTTTKDLIDYEPQFDLSLGLSNTIDFYKN